MFWIIEREPFLESQIQSPCKVKWMTVECSIRGEFGSGATIMEIWDVGNQREISSRVVKVLLLNFCKFYIIERAFAVFIEFYFPGDWIMRIRGQKEKKALPGKLWIEYFDQFINSPWRFMCHKLQLR